MQDGDVGWWGGRRRTLLLWTISYSCTERMCSRSVCLSVCLPLSVCVVISHCKGKGWALVIAPQVDTATTEVLRYMARTKKRLTYLPLYLPSRSRYSFTDPERMEGWVIPGPGCKEQLAHGYYATARSQRDLNPRPRGHWWSVLTTRLSRYPLYL